MEEKSTKGRPVISVRPRVSILQPSSALSVAGLQDPPEVRILRLLVLPRVHRSTTVEEAQVIDEELPLEVVQLVLQADGQQVCPFELEWQSKETLCRLNQSVFER